MTVACPAFITVGCARYANDSSELEIRRSLFPSVSSDKCWFGQVKTQGSQTHETQQDLLEKVVQN